MKLPILLNLTLMSLASHASDILIDGVYIPQMPPGTKVHAAYMQISNQSDQQRQVVAVSAEGFSMAHIHQTVIDKDSASMLMIDELVIPAGETLVMEPGGMHLMLMSADSQTLPVGKIAIKFEFKNGEVVETVARIREYN